MKMTFRDEKSENRVTEVLKAKPAFKNSLQLQKTAIIFAPTKEMVSSYLNRPD